ncbi:hypothetical protein C8R46DRAFT_1041017 [Mycena filopes]|nr:hypothetical protein C8R46DRAFT_1041017 [Mycena filopes]
MHVLSHDVSFKLGEDENGADTAEDGVEHEDEESAESSRISGRRPAQGLFPAPPVHHRRPHKLLHKRPSVKRKSHPAKTRRSPDLTPPRCPIPTKGEGAEDVEARVCNVYRNDMSPAMWDTNPSIPRTRRGRGGLPATCRRRVLRDRIPKKDSARLARSPRWSQTQFPSRHESGEGKGTEAAKGRVDDLRKDDTRALRVGDADPSKNTPPARSRGELAVNLEERVGRGRWAVGSERRDSGGRREMGRAVAAGEAENGRRRPGHGDALDVSRRPYGGHSGPWWVSSASVKTRGVEGSRGRRLSGTESVAIYADEKSGETITSIDPEIAAERASVASPAGTAGLYGPKRHRAMGGRRRSTHAAIDGISRTRNDSITKRPTKRPSASLAPQTSSMERAVEQ